MIIKPRITGKHKRLFLLLAVLFGLIALINVVCFFKGTDSETSYPQKELERKYNSEFIYLSKNFNEVTGQTVYHFQPSTRPDLTVTVNYSESSNQGTMQVMPFAYQTVVTDDFWQQIVDEIVCAHIGEIWDLSSVSLEDAVQTVQMIQAEIQQSKTQYIKKYINNNTYVYVDDRFCINVSDGNISKDIHFDINENTESVRNKIEAFLLGISNENSTDG